jgi:hypothetical protein
MSDTQKQKNVVLQNTNITSVDPSSYYVTVPINASANNYTWTGGGSGGLIKGGTQDMEIQGNLKVRGIDIADAIVRIEKRLLILRPDPKLLEKYQSLREAYEHYQTLEALCRDEDNHGT